MARQKFKIIALAVSLIALSGCKTTGKVVSAPFKGAYAVGKGTVKAVGAVGGAAVDTGEFVGEGAIDAGKAVGKGVYGVGKGVYFIVLSVLVDVAK